jgi:hypothetical protein
MNAEVTWGMVSAYHKLLIRFAFYNSANVLFGFKVFFKCILRRKSTSLGFVPDHPKVVHHGTHVINGQLIAIVHVGPQGATNKGHIVYLKHITFQHVNVGQVGQAFCQASFVFAEVAVIVFMIAQYIDHMWESLTASLHELVPALTFGALTHDVVSIIVTQILYYQNIAAEDQHISTIAVVKVQVPKLKV